MFPHVVLATQVPTAWEVVVLLEALHCLYGFEVGAVDIKKDIPVIATFDPGETIELQRVHNTLVLMPRYFISQVRFLYWNYSTRLLFLYTTAFWIMEKYRARSILKPAFKLVCVPAAFLLGRGCVLFAVHVYAVVQLLPVHPDALEGLFAVGLAQVDRSFHALGLDKLDFRCHLYQVFLRLDSFFILNDR